MSSGLHELGRLISAEAAGCRSLPELTLRHDRVSDPLYVPNDRPRSRSISGDDGRGDRGMSLTGWESRSLGFHGLSSEIPSLHAGCGMLRVEMPAGGSNDPASLSLDLRDDRSASSRHSQAGSRLCSISKHSSPAHETDPGSRNGCAA